MTDNPKTIRLLFPQWQGGNNPVYQLGSKLLEWLAPKTEAPLIQVPVTLAKENQEKPELENGIVYRSQVIQQMKDVKEILEKETPDKIVTFGGDCLVGQMPIDYLNVKYGGKIGILWLDAHPDVKCTGAYPHAHAMVLGNIMGEGDKELASYMTQYVSSNRVMYGGLIEKGLTDQELEVINRLKLRIASPQSLEINSNNILEWIKEENIQHLAIHIDLDVLNPDLFRNLLFAEPNPTIKWRELYPSGLMTMEQLSRVINDVSGATKVVGINICEHLPFDCSNLSKMLKSIPILND